MTSPWIPDELFEPTLGVKMRARENLPSPPKCRGKVKYDKKGAQTVKNDRFRRDHVELRVYHCPHCDGWHVTKNI